MTWYATTPKGAITNTMTQCQSNDNMNNHNHTNNPPRLSSLLSSSSSTSASSFQGTRNTRIEQPTTNNRVSNASSPFSIFGKKRTFQEHTTAIPFSNNSNNINNNVAGTTPYVDSSTSSQWVSNEPHEDVMMNDEQFLCTKRVRYSMRSSSSSSSSSAFLSPIVSWCRSKSGSTSTTATTTTTTTAVMEGTSRHPSQRAELVQRCQQYQKNSDQLSYCHVCNIPYAPYLSVLGDSNNELHENDQPRQRNTLLSYFTKVKKNKASTSSTSFMVSDNDIFERMNDRMNSTNPNEKSYRIQSSLSSLFVSQSLKTSPSSLTSSMSFNPQSSVSASTFVCSYCEHTNICPKCRKQCSVCYKQFCSFCVTNSSTCDTTGGCEQMICADCSSNHNSGATSGPNQMNNLHQNQNEPEQVIRRSTSTYDFDTMDLDD